MERVILHADMNNCYASIEVKLHPEWRGLPLAVCGSEEDRHGIVLAKSQEAKVLGVKTGEVVWQAKQKCPNLLVVPPHYDEYLKYSRLAREIYYEYTNQVEPFGLDECWLDVTASTNLFGSGKEIADEIRKRIRNELGITVSIGVSYNKVFAKLGSDLNKPDAVTVISKYDFKEVVWKLDISEMIGIGRATKRRLNDIGIKTLGDLAKSDPKILKSRLGVNGVYLWNYANGRDDSPVTDSGYRAPIKSIGKGITCTSDLQNCEEVRNVIKELSIGVSKKLRENDLEAYGIQISVRGCDLITHQYQCKLPYNTLSSITLSEAAYKLFKLRYDWRKSVRSITIRTIDLIKRGAPSQLCLFTKYIHKEKNEKLDETIYEVREKYGDNSITFGSLMGDIKMPKDRTDVVTLPTGLVF